jgi:putative hydrolase of HD superfamily
MTPNTQGLVDIGELVFKFARVNRGTYLDDGMTSESDTDHTVMLSICACALAEKTYKDILDLGKVAQFAIVHDLVEAYAGDTDSFGISEGVRASKEQREKEAYEKICQNFDGVFPWIGETIGSYEALDTKEARFVKTIDKAMHKISHVLNNGAYFKKKGMDEATMWNNYTTLVRGAEQKYGAEFPEVISILEELMEEARKKTYV